mmetsp:Transcript_10336/g.11069  ORF Transcript_10336/g.11069 Transcript_10336/m.11069 type:complete len:105 (-) Transcript_10336:463-777(-)
MNEAKKKETPSSSCVVVRPHVNQIEASVFLQHRNILEYCRLHGIVTVAYSPLGRGILHVTSNDTVQYIATKYKIDAGKVAIKYLFQKGYGCVDFGRQSPSSEQP